MKVLAVELFLRDIIVDALEELVYQMINILYS